MVGNWNTDGITDRIREIKEYADYALGEWNILKEDKHNVRSAMDIASFIQKIEDLVLGVHVDDGLHHVVVSYLKTTDSESGN